MVRISVNRDEKEKGSLKTQGSKGLVFAMLKDQEPILLKTPNYTYSSKVQKAGENSLSKKWPAKNQEKKQSKKAQKNSCLILF